MARLIPKLTRSELLRIVGTELDIVTEKVFLVGIRGYYSKTFGERGNDRGVYDDAIFIVSMTGLSSFQANTDPAKYRPGIATLRPGIYDVVKWKHRGRYDALQIVRDRLDRDGESEIDTGRHGINFHFGSRTQTWSEGCQTLPQDTYWRFLKTVYRLMDTHKKKTIKYLLIEQ